VDRVVTPLTIGRRRVGSGHPCFLIAEAGVNHNGSLALGRRLIDAAAAAGADVVKFQTFSADRLAAPSAPKARYQKKTTGAAGSQRDMLRRLELTPAMHEALLAHCRRRNILFLSTPFDEGSADLLERLGVSAYKIPSGEITNLPFLAHVARKGKPVILSTGMSTLEEVRAAVRTVRAAGGRSLALLHCVSLYPTDPADVNLRAMATLEEEFRAPTGFSDHTPGTAISLAAAALGACVIEKHFTMDKTLPGPDHRMSLDPSELRAWVAGIRAVESALGSGRKAPVAGEREIARVARKSLAAARDIPAGAVLTPDMVVRLRPGTGMSPAALPSVLGKKARRAVPAGTILAPGMFS
jgi:N,N'-diacetyllegionaminate synthase